MRTFTPLVLAFLSGVLLQTTGCTLKGTTQQIFDTTSNVTASTSGRIWWNEDGVLNSEHKAIAFATYNGANLEQDIARGGGEYLTSFGAILGVDDSASPSFRAAAQGHFQSLMPADHETRVQHLRALAE